MRKFFSIVMLFASLVCVQLVFVSCGEDNDDYYAGESAEDYKTAVYTVTSKWDLSGVEGLSSSEKNQLEAQLEAGCKTSQEFDSRAEAVAAFDEVVNELSHDSDLAKLKGMKATLYLKRAGATIKSAKIEW